MANETSLLNKRTATILTNDETPKEIILKIPTVGEVRENERTYYSLTTSLTDSPFTRMAQLDSMGLDYTTVSEWDLFRMMFQSYAEHIRPIDAQLHDLTVLLGRIDDQTSEEYKEISLALNEVEQKRKLWWEYNGFDMVFGDMELGGFQTVQDENGNPVLYNSISDTTIDYKTYLNISSTIREINSFEHIKSKPGNESAKKYLLEKERRRLKKLANKPYKSQLQKLIVALVNTSEFPYNYESCMDITIYNFNCSFKQIYRKISFDKTMIGLYAGTVDPKKMPNKDSLSWIPTD